jgi:uncharacterized membrane protein YesL
MVSPPAILGQATRRWWYDWTVIVIVCPLWLLAQLTIVAGPPATAVLYSLMRSTAEGHYYGPGDTWLAFRQMFWPAWGWALINLIVWGIGAVNLLYYWPEYGYAWLALRLLWIGALSLWLALNLFYWPFWLAQSDRSMRNTYANAGRFLLLNPLPALVLSMVCAGVLAVSAMTVIPMVLGAPAWVALVGILTVEQAVERQRRPDTLP